jgi:hypothetical protein
LVTNVQANPTAACLAAYRCCWRLLRRWCLLCRLLLMAVLLLLPLRPARVH